MAIKRPMRTKKHFFPIFLILIFQFGGHPAFGDRAAQIQAHVPRLVHIISSFNLAAREKALADKTYKGEEGILGMVPHVGESLGLRIMVDNDFLMAKARLREAEDLLKQTLEAMKVRESGARPDTQVKTIAELGLANNAALTQAQEHLRDYRNRLTVSMDERLNPSVCARVMEQLLLQYLEKASYNLRDGLGRFFNRCRDIQSPAPLNLENIKFVNHVFHAFTKNDAEDITKVFDLDITRDENVEKSRSLWRCVLGSDSMRFADELAEAFEKNTHPIDRLLFLALIRQESNCDPRNISYVGAAGLTQIMPGTAKGLGMKQIYEPPYFKQAGALLARDRKLRYQAESLVSKMSQTNSLVLAKKARALMQQALDCHEKWRSLYSRYRRELLKAGSDDRLDPAKAIAYGLKYFTRMMKIHGHDMSLALAAYNSGPHRVKQYQGIPPFEETIDFRNRVLQYYREYQTRLAAHTAEKPAASAAPVLPPDEKKKN